MNCLYSIYSTCLVKQHMRNDLEIAFDTGLVSQSNVLNWSTPNSHSSNPTKHMWQQRYGVIGKPHNKQFISLYYRHSFWWTGSQHDHASNTNTGPEMQQLEALKIQQNRSSSQFCAKQETGKCCVVPSAERWGRLAGQWIGLKQGEQTERWRKTDGYIADMTGCDTNALSLTAVLTVLCLRK